MVDNQEGVLGIQWIEGKSVRFLLGGGAEGEVEDDSISEASEDLESEREQDEDPLLDYNVTKGCYTCRSYLL